ncbi:MAG TPA: nucleoside deaminase [Nitrospirota bacterium]|nr:nucleoside deaminase [Nitrospirota bacterium]
MHTEVCIRLPDWFKNFMATSPEVFPNVEDRMRFVISLARQNVLCATGGPFASAVFDRSGRLIAPGVNMVVTSNCSVLHAEIVALVLAQKTLDRYDLSNEGRLDYELVAATEPCAMCFGAVPWSGVRRLVCGARDEDARAIGFDEGPKLDDWVAALNNRGITVVRDVLREEAVAVLREYVAAGGPIYNSGRPADHHGNERMLEGWGK